MKKTATVVVKQLTVKTHVKAQQSRGYIGEA